MCPQKMGQGEEINANYITKENRFMVFEDRQQTLKNSSLNLIDHQLNQ